jgi:hypothetical protein
MEVTMSNKQQTAVEWLIDQLIEHRIIIVDKTTYQVKYKHEILLEQAKEMHRQEIINAVDGFPLENRNLNGTEYYEQTYGGNNDNP